MFRNPFEKKYKEAPGLEGLAGVDIAELQDEGGRKFLGTFPEGHEEEAREFAKKHQGKVKLFGIHISKVDPATNKALEWKEELGYSVWK